MSTDLGGSGEFIRPFLHALAKVRQRETLRPEQLRERAARLLSETFAASADEPVTQFGIGHVGLVSEHTYYFDGFALLLPLPHGVALAVRSGVHERSRVVFEGAPPIEVPASDAGGVPAFPVATATNGRWPSRGRAVDLIARILPPGRFDLALVSTIPSACEDGYLSAVACAIHQATSPAPASWDMPTLQRLAGAVESACERPFGVAPLIAAREAKEGHALLVDTEIADHIGVQLPAVETMACSLVDTHHVPDHRPSVYRRRREEAAAILEKLHEVGFADLGSLSDLEHRHLQLAIKRLPRKLHAPLRYLVTENRRVQRLVAALRRGDTQLFGAFLHMSNASIVNDWKERNAAIEHVRAVAEEIEGIEGVRRVGREFGSAALITGRALAMTQFLDRMAESRAGDSSDTEAILL